MSLVTRRIFFYRNSYRLQDARGVTIILKIRVLSTRNNINEKKTTTGRGTRCPYLQEPKWSDIKEDPSTESVWTEFFKKAPGITRPKRASRNVENQTKIVDDGRYQWHNRVKKKWRGRVGKNNLFTEITTMRRGVNVF